MPVTYKALLDNNNLRNIFLITPDTSEARIRQIDDLSQSFIYLVSSASITGKTGSFGDEQKNYFQEDIRFGVAASCYGRVWYT